MKQKYISKNVEMLCDHETTTQRQGEIMLLV